MSSSTQTGDRNLAPRTDGEAKILKTGTKTANRRQRKFKTENQKLSPNTGKLSNELREERSPTRRPTATRRSAENAAAAVREQLNPRFKNPDATTRKEGNDGTSPGREEVLNVNVDAAPKFAKTRTKRNRTESKPRPL